MKVLSIQIRRKNKTKISFSSSFQHEPNSTYDRLFHVKHGYQSKIHRDDREHTRGLNVHDEVYRTPPPFKVFVLGERIVTESDVFNEFWIVNLNRYIIGILKNEYN